MQTKSEMRKIQKSLRKSLDMNSISEAIIRELFSLPEFIQAENIFTYISFEDEVNTNSVLRLSDKNIFVPKIVGDNLFFSKYERENLEKNKYGILEPKVINKVISSNNDIIITPALAVDKEFNRLGYGGGYYDRFLKNTNSVKVVLLPKSLLVSIIQSDNFDIKCDIVVTEDEIMRRIKC